MKQPAGGQYTPNVQAYRHETPMSPDFAHIGSENT